MGGAGRAGIVAVALVASILPACAASPAQKLEPCLSCHGADGRSETENVPSLGGQLASYTLIQLFMFRERLRIAEPMNDQAKELSDDDLRSIADAIAASPPPKPPADPGDPARLEKARALTNQYHCKVCHRPDFSGQESAPRLAHQREDYLLKTLRDYKSGVRHGYDATMAEVLQPVDDAQIADLAYYLAHAP
jgi:cytochrome c553